MNLTVAETMQRPDVVLFARELEAALIKEEAARKHFYEVVDENKKMEFINGEIYFQSPVKAQHNQASLNLVKLLDSFVKKHRLGFVGIEKILVSLSRNDYEPDICFFGREKSDTFEARQMQFPAPDFVVEVLSDSTERNDREIKFTDYAVHGVGEYWIIDADKQVVEQYVINGDGYHLALKASDGHIASEVVKGFRIEIKAIFDDVLNLAELARILAE